MQLQLVLAALTVGVVILDAVAVGTGCTDGWRGDIGCNGMVVLAAHAVGFGLVVLDAVAVGTGSVAVFVVTLSAAVVGAIGCSSSFMVALEAVAVGGTGCSRIRFCDVGCSGSWYWLRWCGLQWYCLQWYWAWYWMQ